MALGSFPARLLSFLVCVILSKGESGLPKGIRLHVFRREADGFSCGAAGELCRRWTRC